MSYLASSNQPGLVFIEDVSRGRRKNFGTLAYKQGQMSMCIGYTEEGKQAVYAPLTQLKDISRKTDKASRKLSYRIASWVMSRYQVS